jgi:hypothetical protein
VFPQCSMWAVLFQPGYKLEPNILFSQEVTELFDSCTALTKGSLFHYLESTYISLKSTLADVLFTMTQYVRKLDYACVWSFCWHAITVYVASRDCRHRKMRDLADRILPIGLNREYVLSTLPRCLFETTQLMSIVLVLNTKGGPLAHSIMANSKLIQLFKMGSAYSLSVSTFVSYVDHLIHGILIGRNCKEPPNGRRRRG